MWIIWFAILQGVFVIQFLVGGGLPEGENAVEPMAPSLWALCFGPILLATAIRWLLIPKVKTRQTQLTAMIVGLSLAEAPILLSLFLVGPDYPQNHIAVLMVGLAAIFQFAPKYAATGDEVEPPSL